MKDVLDTGRDTGPGASLESMVDLTDRLDPLALQAGNLRFPDQRCKIFCNSDKFQDSHANYLKMIGKQQNFPRTDGASSKPEDFALPPL
jgi:hypothetical protein